MVIGLGICTYHRIDYLKQCIESLEDNNWGGADEVVVVDDCSTDGTQDYLNNKNIYDNVYLKEENKGVAHSKNIIINELMDKGCDHIFIMEDDILMKNSNTCQHYIDYAKRFKLEHLNFAHHGPMNKQSLPDYKGITVYPNCVGAFSYYTRNCIDKVGLMDENFKNAFEHVYHTWRCAKEGLTTPFWKFADHPLSHKMLEEIPGSIDNSSIRCRADWQDNIRKAQAYWIQKEGCWLPPRD